MANFIDRVAQLQAQLKAPKSQFNKFGNYAYRNCEDILEAFKAVKSGLVLTVSDAIEVHGDRVYVVATATLTDGKDSISNKAYAREAQSKKGMDDSQLTGATSSYARKYALNGLLCIDDTKDADSHDNRNNTQNVQEIKSTPQKREVKPGTKLWENAKQAYLRDGHLKSVLEKATMTKAHQEQLMKECA